MRRCNKFILFIINITCLSLFLSYSKNLKVEKNAQAIEEKINSLLNNKNISNLAINSKRINFQGQKESVNLNIENESDIFKFSNESNVNSYSLINELIYKSTFISNNYSNFEINNTTIEINNYDDFNYFIRENKNIYFQNKIKNLNMVNFTGINISKKTCTWIYEKSLLFIDKQVNNYKGLGGIIYTVLKMSAPFFVTKCSFEIGRVINKLTSWLASIGPWGLIMQMVLIIFSTIAVSILCMIIWAGSHHKGFKMGLQWYGFFKTKWVSEFYD